MSKETVNILLVEDNPGDARLIEIYLNEQTESNFVISRAETLKEALAFAPSSINCVLLDLSLPDSSGVDTIKRAIKHFEDTPVIVQTGLDDSSVGVEAVEHGAFDYLVKGDLNTRILIKTISYAIIRSENEGLRTAKDLAERSAELKQRFLATMSHEMRTPLNVLKGMTKLLLESEYLPKQKEYLDSLQISADNLMRVISDILDISKIESNKIELESQHFDLNKLLDEILVMYKFRTQEKGLGLFSQFDTSLPQFVIADSVRLNQVLINLMDNAIKYTEKGELTLRAVLLETKGDKINIEFGVKDTGIGIPEDKKEAIFESFVQASASTTRLYGGTGLGLSIARHLVGLFGGNIKVESKLGEGSFFKFNTWLTIDKEEFKPDEIALPKFENIDKYKSNIKVLMVEDHALNQKITKKLLERWCKDIELEIADNGLIGFEKVRDGDFDIVLMDVSMPVLDGIGASKKIRTELPQPKCNIPIIAMTAHAFKTEIDRCFEAGMNDFVSKPVDFDKFYEALNLQVLKLVEEGKIKDRSKGATMTTKDSQTIRQEQALQINTNEVKIDLSYLRELAGGDEEFVLDLVRAFLTDLPVQTDLLEKYFDAQNFEEYKKVAHKLKNSYKYIGFEILEEYETVILSVLKVGVSEFNFTKEELIRLILKSDLAIQELKAIVA